MDSLVLYCKSYHKDVDRVALLLDSIRRYNVDSIPFYISVPASDLELFRTKLGTEDYELVSDESIDQEGSGWTGQQVIKSQFWKLELCHNYLCLDSDSEFIKPFCREDFLYEGNIPYTVCHEQKELFEWSQKSLHFDPQEGFQVDRKKVMDLFGRRGRYYDFGPSPVIWNREVWRGLEELYIKPNNLTFGQLIDFSHSEFTWYGEFLLKSKIIPIYPTQPLFKVFHYPGQYVEMKQKGYTLEDISKNYLGVILQSNWGAPLNY
tara:strand:- start:204 stop:992 length:789 start_codon:yes stop_codon:yes gene_type:complete